ncbi:9787_t:CDS:2 [Entrophospora sp. SA101]|nr:9787_t:CDS:2 [Entrophospora sp. SA101]
MDTLFENFEILCEEEGIKFDASNQRVSCLAHIINLAAQSTLKSLKCLAPEEESSPLDDTGLTDNGLKDYVLSNFEQPNVVDAAKKAQEKLQKYYPMSDGLVYVIAAIIDPHLKIEYYIDNEFGNNYIEIYKNQIKKLWESYIPNNQHEEVQNDKKPSALAPHMQKKHKHSNDDELKIFLNSSTINFDSDVLEFWKLHKIEYPHLSNMARDFLAIPALQVRNT